MSANKLVEQLIDLNRQEFTGVVTIKARDERYTWEMFFHSGEYLWTEGGYHPNRSWRRSFNYHFPKVDTDIILRQQANMRSPHYSLLNTLLQRKAIERERAKALLITRSQEILFDLLQKEHNDALDFAIENTSAHYLLKAGFNLTFMPVDLEQAVSHVQTEWLTWTKKGLASCSPHHAPLLVRYQELQLQLPDLVYSNMSRLLNGKRTLRDLTLKMDKPILELTLGIVPYFFKGYLRLLEIPDLPQAQSAILSSKTAQSYP